MPKKGKKGKGKKGSGKKGAKKAKKDLSIKSMSEANSKLWETRLTVTEASRQEYRDATRKLLLENEVISNQMRQTEKDTIDVISYLKRQDLDKDRELEKFQTSIKDLKKEHRKESGALVDEFQQQISNLEQELMQKTHEVEIMQNELKQVKEFRRKRAQMQRELEEIKENMFEANREHKDTIQRMEHKFFEEKMRLQQEANQKIAELAERAHSEAIINLDEATKSVYQENVRINEALGYHIEESDKLRSDRDTLEKENNVLKGDKEINEAMIHEKVKENKHNKSLIKQMQEKIEILEKSLSYIVNEFETEKHRMAERAMIEMESSKNEIIKLQRIVDMKSREMNKVKKLGRNILEERTEMERFFLEALEHVKQKIATNRMQYRKDAQLAYQQRMLAAHTGQSDFPKIRTFNKSDTSTNSVFRDLEAAENMLDVSGKVDISDLTWEQKERVLRYLFAKLNGAKEKRGKSTLSAINAESTMSNLRQYETWREADNEDKGDTFLTQVRIGEDGVLPRIQPSPAVLHGM